MTEYFCWIRHCLLSFIKNQKNLGFSLLRDLVSCLPSVIVKTLSTRPVCILCHVSCIWEFFPKYQFYIFSPVVNQFIHYILHLIEKMWFLYPDHLTEKAFWKYLFKKIMAFQFQARSIYLTSVFRLVKGSKKVISE